MRLVLAVFVAVFAGLLPVGALACDCGWQGTIESSREEAESIAIIRIVEAVLERDERHVRYRFETVGLLRGYLSPGPVRAVFQTCCGTRVDVGHHYLVFLRSGQAFDLMHEGNALPLGPRLDSWRVRQARDLVDGIESFDRLSYPSFWASQVPPPPPPPCPEPAALNHPVETVHPDRPASELPGER